MFCFQSISEIRQEDQGIFLDLILDMNRKFYTMESVEWKNIIILSFGKTEDNQDKLLTKCKSCAAKPLNHLNKRQKTKYCNGQGAMNVAFSCIKNSGMVSCYGNLLLD